MVSGSKRRALLLLLIPLLSGGCFTGHLLEASRIRESVEEYEVAYRDSGRLVLGYRVRLEGADGQSLGDRRRAAAIPLASLRASPALNVDAFPVEGLRRRDLSQDTARHLELRAMRPGDEVEPFGRASAQALQIEVDANERHVGVWWADGLREPVLFHSGALNQSHHAWWTYPLLPFSLAIDLVLLVPQIPAATPLFVSGE